MAKQNILIIEDEINISEMINVSLLREGYQVICVSSGNQALTEIKNKLPNLILLDLMLPDMDGLDICRILKNNPQTQSIPIIIITAKDDESDIIAGLTLGADDYITKPFSLKILTARVKAVLRRKRDLSETKEIIKYRELEIDPEKFLVTAKGKSISLTNTEFQTLYLLASNPGKVFTRDQIIDAIKGDSYDCIDRSIDILIVRIRKKIKPYNKYLETLWGIGYRFKDQNE